MLLIDCPYCGMARPEIEFAYGGEAHIARAADPGTLSDEELADFLLLPLQSKGRSRRALAPFVWLRTLLQLSARHIERQDSRDLQDG